MTNFQPQYETMLEHYLLCLNDECSLADKCLHWLAAISGRQMDEVVTMTYGMVDLSMFRWNRRFISR